MDSSSRNLEACSMRVDREVSSEVGDEVDSEELSVLEALLDCCHGGIEDGLGLESAMVCERSCYWGKEEKASGRSKLTEEIAMDTHVREDKVRRESLGCPDLGCIGGVYGGGTTGTFGGDVSLDEVRATKANCGET